MKTYDKLGIALSSYDGYQRSKDGSKGYRWSNYILDLTNTYPEYIIPTANGGTNKNWTQQKESFISQLEKEIQTGKYLNMGELELEEPWAQRSFDPTSLLFIDDEESDAPSLDRIYADIEMTDVSKAAAIQTAPVSPLTTNFAYFKRLGNSSSIVPADSKGALDIF